MTGADLVSVGLTAAVTLGLAAAGALLTRGSKPPREVCPVCHVRGGWHKVDVHEPEAVS